MLKKKKRRHREPGIARKRGRWRQTWGPRLSGVRDKGVVARSATSSYQRWSDAAAGVPLLGRTHTLSGCKNVLAIRLDYRLRHVMTWNRWASLVYFTEFLDEAAWPSSTLSEWELSGGDLHLEITPNDCIAVMVSVTTSVWCFIPFQLNKKSRKSQNRPRCCHFYPNTCYFYYFKILSVTKMFSLQLLLYFLYCFFLISQFCNINYDIIPVCIHVFDLARQKTQLGKISRFRNNWDYFPSTLLGRLENFWRNKSTWGI